MESVILHDEPWISYFDNGTKRTLSYPKNVVFVAQFLTRHLKDAARDVYNAGYPDAEKFNLQSLNEVNWQNSILIFDRYFNLIVAPEPLKRLANLDRRLRYKRAHDHIFGGVRFFPKFMEIFRLRWFLALYVFLSLLLYRNMILRSIRSAIKTWKRDGRSPSQIPRFYW